MHERKEKRGTIPKMPYDFRKMSFGCQYVNLHDTIQR